MGMTGEIRKWTRFGIGMGGKILGAGVALSPTFRGLGQIANGQFNAGFDSIAFDTTGAIPSSGQGPQLQPVLKTVGTVIVGIALMKLFSFVARRI